MVQETSSGFGRTVTRVGIAGAIALGAVASGLLLSRSGRRLLGEVWQGRQRTTIEDRVPGVQQTYLRPIDPMLRLRTEMTVEETVRLETERP